METRAHFVLIGLFTLLGVLGAFIFFVWFARVQIDRQYAYYDVVFENVSGLGRASDVRYSGLAVGQVISLELYRKDPRKIVVRVEIEAETPIKTDTRAQLQAQGVTGVSFVSLVGGSIDAPTLRSVGTTGVPVIFAERSAIQALAEDAPDMLTEATLLMRRLAALASPENSANVASILANFEQASRQFGLIAAGVDGSIAAVNQTLGRIDEALASADLAFAAAAATFDKANTLIDEDAAPVLGDIRTAAKRVETVATMLSNEAPAVVLGLQTAADRAASAMNRLDSVVAGAAPPIRTFVETGLPEYARLARDGRDLITTLRRLADRLQRDPARFFFGDKPPQFRSNAR